VLLLAATDLAARRDAAALLLLPWVLGTYLFAAYFNWALNGRSVLPLLPAVAILIVRRLDQRYAGVRLPGWLGRGVLVPALTLALVVTWADVRQAGAQRLAADRLAAAYAADPDRQLWYTGHWGFQYYMMERGALPWDYAKPSGRAGDWIVVPENNTKYPVELPPNVRDVGVLQVPACPWLTTLHKAAGAGYYSDYWGPLPFAFGAVPPEGFVVKELLPPANNSPGGSAQGNGR
jgi:hypothetical protein